LKHKRPNGWFIFKNAENESELSLLEQVSWQEVKEYFTRQAKEIEKSWIE